MKSTNFSVDLLLSNKKSNAEGELNGTLYNVEAFIRTLYNVKAIIKSSEHWLSNLGVICPHYSLTILSTIVLGITFGNRSLTKCAAYLSMKKCQKISPSPNSWSEVIQNCQNPNAIKG